MMEKLIVDRIVEGIAVLEKEDRSHIEMPVDSIDFKVKEGSVLLFDGEKYTLDSNAEDERRKKLFAMQEMLKNRK